MSSIPSLSPFPVAATPDAGPVIALDPEFEARWAKWVKRGHTHEGVVRRKLIMLGGVLLAVVGAVAYTLTR
jgi:hypothetical protein